MKYILCALMCVYTCTLSAQIQTKPYSFTTNKTYDETWSKIQLMIFQMTGAKITANNKDQGVFVVQLKNAPLSYLEKDGKLADPTASIYAEVKKRSPMFSYKYYPREGLIDWSMLIQKNSDNTTTVIVKPSRVMITKFFENGLLASKRIRNENAWSTGLFEKQLEEQLKN